MGQASPLRSRAFVSLLIVGLAGCPRAAETPDADDGDEQPRSETRADGAQRVRIEATGSLQNPAWSPDGDSLLLTRFRTAYNSEPADLLVVDVEDGEFRTLVADGSANVNLPGSSWNAATGMIVFSSSREPHDEIYLIGEDGPPERTITERADTQAFEPSLSPDGQRVVFESHPLDVEGQGVITVYRLDGSEPYQAITAADDDCRQPNWSPAGDRIVYQRLSDGQWDLWLTDPEGQEHQQLTTGGGDKTDASFSPDGQRIVYSSNEHGGETANLFVISISGGASTRVTFFDGYDGAPSWSPDGSRIAFESFPGDPDGSPGTTIWTIGAPEP